MNIVTYREDQYARFGRRFAAFLINELIFLLVFTILFLIALLLMNVIMLILVLLCIPVLDIALHHRFGATPGQMVLGIRVVSVTGGHPTLTQATVRFFCHILSGIPFYYGYLRSIWHPRHQTWHDQIAGTYSVLAGSVPGGSVETSHRTLVNWRQLATVAALIAICFLGLLYGTHIWFERSETYQFLQRSIANDPVAHAMVGTELRFELKSVSPAILVPTGRGKVQVRVLGNTDTLEALFYASANGAYTVPMQYRFPGSRWADEDELADSLTDHFGGLAERFFASGQLDSALVLSNKALQLSPDYEWIQTFRDDIVSDYDRASEVLVDESWEFYRQLHADDLCILDVRGLALCAIGRPRDGLAKFDTVLSRYPWFMPAYIDKGWAFALLDQPDSAEFYYDRFIAANPCSDMTDSLAVLRLRGEVLAGTHQTSERIIDSESPNSEPIVSDG